MWRCIFGGNSFNGRNGPEVTLETYSAANDGRGLTRTSPGPGPLQLGAAYQAAASALHKQQSSPGLDSPRRAFQIKTEMQSPLPSGMPGSGQVFSSSRYQQLASKLVNMVNMMRAAGAQFTLDLPTVVVCGNQSAGKSSLVEGIINITLPRSDSTCTRCPVEVRMSEEPQPGVGWSCIVRLRIEYDEYGMRLPQPQEVAFQEGITDPLQVEKAVRLAQAALLAPPPDMAAAGPNEQLKFTRNVVVLEIRGAPVNLTLIDLPGIIQNVERPQDRPYRELVTSLVHEYIMRDNAIIVATISCKEDIETQGVLSLAREVDPDGSRTVGVLTKPDQIEEACHGQWLSVLKGDRYPLKLGYYVVRNPNQVQLLQGITFEEARQGEGEFFKASNPWCHMFKFADRFGVDHLRANLSQVLVEITNRAKPRMQSVLTEKLAEVRSDLMKLPLLLAADPHSDLLRMIEELSSNIQDQVRAKGNNKSFYQRILVHFEEFKACIYRSRPVFLVNASAAPFTCMVDDDYRDEAAGPMPDILAGSGEPGPGPMTMEDVREIVMQHHSIELPGFSPYSAVQALITLHQQHWPSHTERCLQKALHELQRMVDRNIAATFARFPRALELVSTIGRELLDSLYGQSLTVVRALVAMESGNAFTLNRHEFEQLSGQYLEQLKAAKSNSPSAPPSAPHSRTTSAHNLTSNLSISLAAHPPARQTSSAVSTLTSSPTSRPLKDFSFQTPTSPGASAALNKLSPRGSELLKVHDPYDSDMAMPPVSPRGGPGSPGPGSAAAGGHSRQVSSMELYQPMRLWLVPQSDRSDGHILGMMAVSLTYFSVSAKRIADSVPMHVLHYMVSKFADGFRSRLMSEMMAMDNSSVKSALAEDSFTQQQRQALLSQKDLLEKVLKVLKSC